MSSVFPDVDRKLEFNIRRHWKAHEFRFKAKFPGSFKATADSKALGHTCLLCFHRKCFRFLFAYRWKKKKSAIPYCKMRVILLSWAQGFHKDYFCIAIFSSIFSLCLWMLFLCRLKCNTVTPQSELYYNLKSNSVNRKHFLSTKKAALCHNFWAESKK